MLNVFSRYNSSPFSVSILSNTNRVISSSEDNFGSIRPGSLLKFEGENNLYQIFQTKKLIYFKPFSIIDNRQIVIDCNIGINLQPEDIIRIFYDEYELNSIINILNKGKFYSNNEIITIKGGELSIDLSEGIGYPTKLKIEETDENGGVDRVSLINNGKYIVPPLIKSEVYSQNGTDLLFELNYNTIGAKKILERTIKKIEIKNDKSYIYLDYSLPTGIKQGQLSTEKWELLLEKDYLGENKLNTKYQIFSDFTPNFNFPFLSKNSNSEELFFNQTIQKLDSILMDHENRLKNIENNK